MKLAKAEKSFRKIKTDNLVLKIGFGLVISALAVQSFMMATRDEAVVLIPPFQNETIEFINGRANREYYSQWAWSTAMVVGNLTPGNASFVRGELQRISTPGLYRKMMETIDTELQNIVRENATILFSPREVTYDPELDRFFVTGRQAMTGPGVKTPIEKQITYELGFTTERLRIYLSNFAVYEGKPMTAKVRDVEMDRREQKERDAAKKAATDKGEDQ